MKMRHIKSRFRARGLTLLELLIAMTLGLATVGAVVYVYSNTVRTYRTQDSLARLQEGARFAFEAISNDLRMVGAAGCGMATSANVLNGNTNWERNLFARPLFALAQDGTAGAVTQYSDALSIVRADVSTEYRVSSHNTGSSTITLNAAHDITLGQLLVATDCTHAAVFQATSNASPSIGHAASGTPGNSSANLGVAGAPYAFAAGSRVYKLSPVRYYVANNAAGVPSLYRQRPIGSTATVTAEELVEGVEDMRVTFGVDTSSPADGLVDSPALNPYIDIAKIDDGTIAGLGATTDEHWSRIVSVRISFLMRTVDNNIANDPQTYTFNSASSVLATDRRLRKVFTHVVKLRNRT